MDSTFKITVGSGDYLDVTALKAQVAEIVETLDADNENLGALKQVLSNFIDNELKTNAWTSEKLQLFLYFELIGNMISANTLDKEDKASLLTSADSLSEDKYDGATIHDQGKVAFDKMWECMNEYNRMLSLMTSGGWKGIFYSLAFSPEMLNSYLFMAGSYEAEYEEYKKLNNEYISFNTNTASLFKNGEEIRKLVYQGLLDLRDNFSSGAYNVDVSASWLTELANLEENLVEQYRQKYYNGDDINWDAVEKFLRADADSISYAEYQAFGRVIDEMSVDDLNKLFELSIVEKSSMAGSIYSYSETLLVAAALYHETVIWESQDTLFSNQYTDNSQTADYVNAQNRLSKAELVYRLADQMFNGANPYGYKVYFHIETELYAEGSKKNGIPDLLTYSTEVAFENRTTSGIDGITEPSMGDLAETYLVTKDNCIIKVYPYLAGDGMEGVAFEKANGVLSSYIQKPEDVVAGVLKDGCGIIIGFTGNVASITYTVTTSLATYIGGHDGNIVIQSTMDFNDKAQQMDALAMSGQVVCTDSTVGGDSTVVVQNVRYDRNELIIRVAAYNEFYGENYKADDMLDALENNPELIEKYTTFVSTNEQYIENYYAEVNDNFAVDGVVPEKVQDIPTKELEKFYGYEK